MGKFDQPSRKRMTQKIRPKGKKFAWQKHERDAAEQLGGRLTPGSGAKPGFKGDVSCDEHLVECKSTAKRSMSLKLDWLEKISEEAFSRGKTPLVHLRFEEVHGNLCSKDWVMMPASYFKELEE